MRSRLGGFLFSTKYYKLYLFITLYFCHCTWHAIRIALHTTSFYLDTSDSKHLCSDFREFHHFFVNVAKAKFFKLLILNNISHRGLDLLKPLCPYIHIFKIYIIDINSKQRVVLVHILNEYFNNNLPNITQYKHRPTFI